MTAEGLLSTYVQTGVTLAGFSGIVVAFDSHARGEWSARDRHLLLALLGTSGGCALLSALPLLLAASGVADRTVWRVASACSVVLQVSLMVFRTRNITRDSETLTRERLVLALAFGGGAACVAVQLVNCVWLGVAWPHLATLTWNLAMAFAVFVRLVQPEVRR